jgi:hypothetical protein
VSDVVSSRTAPSSAAGGASLKPAGAASTRQLVILAGLAGVLAVLVIFVVLPSFTGGRPGAGRAASANRARAAAPAAARGRQSAPPGGVVDVRLDRLGVPRAEPLEGGRNPFRMGAAPPSPGQTAMSSSPAPAPTIPAGPVGPPPPPPVPSIPLKFLGIISRPGRGGKIAVLSDGRNVFSGEEGGTVDGRYRIVRIGEESIQVEHLDGRGRQTIRLSGQ